MNFSLSHLGTVNNKEKLCIYKANDLIIDLNIPDIKNTYKNSIYKKISN